MTTLWMAWQLGLSLWGLASAWRRQPIVRVRQARRAGTPSPKRARFRWLSDWGGWIVASSVGSLAPALAPEAPLWVQALLSLIASAGLLRLTHALDSPALGQGVVAGLGLIALVLDSLSGGAWASGGALGHGIGKAGIGELYGILTVLWGLIVCRAWLSIEGNPLGAAYLMGLIALWLGWKGLSPALGWGATLTALPLSLLVVQRELTERRRVRLAMQHQPIRLVRVARGYDLALHTAVLLGLCGVALWQSGAPTLQFGIPSPYEGWYLGLSIACGVGLLRWRRRHPLPPVLQRPWLIGVLTTALLSAQPLGVIALGLLLYWASVGTILQETAHSLSNLPPRTGGSE